MSKSNMVFTDEICNLEQKVIDLAEIKQLLAQYVQLQDFNQEIGIFITKLVTPYIEKDASLFSLQDLLQALQIQTNMNLCDEKSINIICNAMKKKNPNVIIQQLQDTYLEQAKDVKQFLAQMKIYINQQHMKNLEKLLNNLEILDFSEFLDCSISKLSKDYRLSSPEASFIHKYLQFYRAISGIIPIQIQLEYKDITNISMQELLEELMAHTKYNPDKSTVKILKTLKIETLFNMKIIEEQRLVTKRQNKFDIINLEKLYECKLSQVEIADFSKSCQQYAVMYNNVLQLQQKVGYVGWQQHWETIIDFVSTHLTGNSFQKFDLLCSLGGPKSGKSITMFLSAVFMMNFVRIIRPQIQQDCFCQNICKLIQINCDDITGTVLQKMKQIYLIISASIMQSEYQLLDIRDNLSLNNVLNAIKTMLMEARCYFVISWDEMQTLFGIYCDKKERPPQEKLSTFDYNLMNSFIKTMMVSQNSPCQHLAAGSLSVALLDILDAIPGNGYCVKRCQHAIVTSTADSMLYLRLVNKVRNLPKIEQDNILSIAMGELQNGLSLTCADLNQIITNINVTIQQNLKNLILQSAQDLIELKNSIAHTWIDKSVKSMNKFHCTIFDLIVGTTHIPDILLIKLCSYNDTTKQYKLRDNTLQISILTKFNELVKADENVNLVYCSTIFQDCGNILKEIKSFAKNNLKCLKLEKIIKQINNYWITIINPQYLKNGQFIETNMQFMLKLFKKSEEGKREFKLEQTQNKLLYTESQCMGSEQEIYISELKQQIDNDTQYLLYWQQISQQELNNLALKQWKQGCDMIERFRDLFSHKDMIWKVKQMKHLQTILIDPNPLYTFKNIVNYLYHLSQKAQIVKKEENKEKAELEEESEELQDLISKDKVLTYITQLKGNEITKQKK
ncbi:Hypothetical_protein [Hexamita inflata]|uniref:Hypothetical_protein n=1 Tax=Hexamita inflata TaxID=28002 RepID=A0AA86U3F8_9EUKA|nr:Hypothetical protein HINF_LOCUS26774 [Hexamita inflata]